jgi:hypothetical protein
MDELLSELFTEFGEAQTCPVLERAAQELQLGSDQFSFWVNARAYL